MQNLQEKHTVLQALEICLEKKLHFAAYRLPGKSTITLIAQKDPEIRALKDLRSGISGKGFLVSSFSGEDHRNYLIKPEIQLIDPVLPEQLNELNALPRIPLSGNGCPCPESTKKADYLHLIQLAVDKIKAGEFEKVVLSRVRSIPGDYFVKLPAIYGMLCEAYPDAFVYLFSVKGQCWMGATPEPFICSNENDLYTVSLAGTRINNVKNLNLGDWRYKELLEQEYVTRHIEKILKTFAVNRYQKKGPYTAKAGNLLHLRTDFTFAGCLSDQSLCALIKALHPTPAVCGMSPGVALDFIQITEKHDREYYTGFLGPVGLGEPLQLWVNLRCMKVLDHRLLLYVGGGITMESVPEAEWEETELKANTLLAVIQNLNDARSETTY